MAHEAYLSIGSNLGDKGTACLAAVKELKSSCNIKVITCSAQYETEPEGYKKQPSFINMAVKIQTALSPHDLLSELQGIEKRLGRVNTFRWGPRVIDIDIILYENEVISSDNLEVPHPRMRERAFVLYPLCELDPDIKEPVTGKSVAGMIKELPHACRIRKLSSKGTIE